LSAKYTAKISFIHVELSMNLVGSHPITFADNFFSVLCEFILAYTWKMEKISGANLKMATCVRKVASEVFGVSRGGKQEGKDTWWWNDEV